MEQSMSNDAIEITVPSGKKVIIRNYTTRGDDKQASALLEKGMTISTDEAGKANVNITAEAVSASEAKYVELLVQSIDGDGDNIAAQLDGLRSDDYAAVAEAVQPIVSLPKAPSKS